MENVEPKEEERCFAEDVMETIFSNGVVGKISNYDFRTMAITPIAQALATQREKFEKRIWELEKELHKYGEEAVSSNLSKHLLQKRIQELEKAGDDLITHLGWGDDSHFRDNWQRVREGK